MNRRAKHYHYVNRNLVPTITRRKERLTRIAANKRKRRLNHATKAMATRSIIYRDERFIGRDGWPISQRAYLKHMGDPYYQCIASSWYRSIRVSTVWMGKFWPLGFGGEFLFETMVFWRSKSMGLQLRHLTEAEALNGHFEVLAEVKANWNDLSEIIRVKRMEQLATCTVDDLDVFTNMPEVTA